MIRGWEKKAGVMQIIPALVFILVALALVLGAVVASAAPPEEKLPELSKPQLHREKTKLEKAVDEAAAMLLQDKLPATEDGVRFALWLYGDKGDVAYLDVATKMARKLVKTDPIMGTAALFWVAQAGGPTLDEAKATKVPKTLNTAGNPKFFLRSYAILGATRDSTELNDYSTYAVWPEGIDLALDDLWLRARTEHLELSGADQVEQKCKTTAHEMLKRYWHEENKHFLQLRSAHVNQQENIRAALSIWQVGVLLGDSGLREVGQNAIDNGLESALHDSKAAAITGLAAGYMSRHHLQLAIIGDPKDSTVTALREAAYFLFEPNKVILNLDPKTDKKRMAELMYSPDAAPAMFVCVETLCSPPIKNPAELEKQVAEIKKLAAEVQQ